MIFQDPMTSLNPVLTVGVPARRGDQDALPEGDGRRDQGAGDRAARPRRRPEPGARYDQYPHEFSGGMRQRAMIAMSIANSPSLLIADEPTTALDVTIQAQMLEVLKTVQAATHAATILITHDLGIVAELCDRVVVMYGGPDRRDGRRPHDLRDAAAPVHDRADEQPAEADRGRGVAPADPRPAAEPDQPAVRLRLPSALLLLAGPRAAAGGGAGAASRWRPPITRRRATSPTSWWAQVEVLRAGARGRRR